MVPGNISNPPVCLVRDKFIDKRELIVTEMERTAHQLEVEETENFGRGQCSRYQKFVWDLMEKPESSTAAKIVSIISMSFVFVSIVGMVISTLPALQFKVRLPSLSLSEYSPSYRHLTEL